MLGLIAVAVVAYWPTSKALWNFWIEDLYDGGRPALVAVLALWLLYRARGRVAAAPPHGLPWVVVLLVPCTIASLIFSTGSIEELQFLLLPALILLAILTAFGAAVTRTLAVPVCFLYFAMPGWNFLAAPLQGLTLAATRLLAPAFGIPLTVSGSLLILPGDMSFTVGPWCSGVEFLVDGLAVATLLGELEQASPARRLRLLASVALVAVVTNWIRVLVIIQVGYATAMRHVLVTRHHLLFGYVLFVLVLVAFVWVASRHTSRGAPVAPSPNGLAAYPAAPDSYVAAMVALAAAPALVAILSWSRDDHAMVVRELRLPSARSGWGGPLDIPDPAWRPVFVGPHEERRGTYRDPAGRSVEAMAIGYANQFQNQELVNEGNSLVGDAGLTLLAGGLASAGGTTYREDIVTDSEGLRSVIWSLYVVGGRVFVKPLAEQLWYGLSGLGTRPYSALFAFKTACAPSCAHARSVLEDFVGAVRPELLAPQAPAQAREGSGTPPHPAAARAPLRAGL